MGLFDNFKKAEVRSLENPTVPVSAENFLHIMGWGDFQSSAGDDLMIKARQYQLKVRVRVRKKFRSRHKNRRASPPRKIQR